MPAGDTAAGPRIKKPEFTFVKSSERPPKRGSGIFNVLELFSSPHVAHSSFAPPTAKWTLPTQHRAFALSFVPARHASSLLRLAARPWLHISRVGFGGFCRPSDADASGSDRSRALTSDTFRPRMHRGREDS